MKLQSLFPVLLTLIGFVHHLSASEPIEIEIGRGRLAALKFSNDADAQFHKGDYENARRNVAEALRRDPEYWPALYTRAKLFMHDGKWEAALRDANQIMALDRTFIPAALMRARANSALGNYGAALKEFDHVISIRPSWQFYAMALNDRAFFRATCPNASFRNPKQAIDDAKKACSITNWREAGSD